MLSYFGGGGASSAEEQNTPTATAPAQRGVATEEFGGDDDTEAVEAALDRVRGALYDVDGLPTGRELDEQDRQLMQILVNKGGASYTMEDAAALYIERALDLEGRAKLQQALISQLTTATEDARRAAEAAEALKTTRIREALSPSYRPPLIPGGSSPQARGAPTPAAQASTTPPPRGTTPTAVPSHTSPIQLPPSITPALTSGQVAGMHTSVRIGLAMAKVQEFQATHSGNYATEFVANALEYGTDPVEAVELLEVAPRFIDYRAVVKRSLELCVHQGPGGSISLKQAWAACLKDWMEKNFSAPQATQLEWKALPAQALLSGVGQLGLNVDRVEPSANTIGEVRAARRLQQQERAEPTQTLPCLRPAARDDAPNWEELQLEPLRTTNSGTPTAASVSRGVSSTHPTTVATEPVFPGDARLLASHVQHALERELNVKTLLDEPRWFAKPLPKDALMADVTPPSVGWDELVNTWLRRSLAHSHTSRHGSAFVNPCTEAAVAALLGVQQGTSSSRNTGGPSSQRVRDTIEYRSTRGQLLELLGEGRLHLLGLGDTLESADNKLLSVLLQACALVPSLGDVVDSCHGYARKRLSTDGVCRVLDHVDAALLKASEEELDEPFATASWEVGQKPLELLQKLDRLGSDLGKTEEQIYRRWRSALRHAVDEEGQAPRPGEQAYVLTVVDRFTNAYVFKNLRALKSELEFSNSSLALNARDSGKAPAKRERGAFPIETAATGSAGGSQDSTTAAPDLQAQLTAALTASLSALTPPQQSAPPTAPASPVVNTANVNAAAGATPAAGVTELNNSMNQLALALAAAHGGAPPTTPPRPNARGGDPQCPLDVEKILASGQLTELSGVVLKPFLNPSRPDGKYGTECPICLVLAPELAIDVDYLDFKKDFGVPSGQPECRTHNIVHYQCLCRQLRRLVGRRSRRDSAFEWMAAPWADYETRRKAAWADRAQSPRPGETPQ